ncbi:hypothetical protein LTSEALA_3061 [Salmonella enterica subsp. enterica serovar Alachua str. R6-377]|uniref:Uncharacterized protein n=1 Tax=Salmonella enterica subsp. enterica serovar Alachua str. R6-377 TaxID=913241 RepID=G5LQH7_SALET|nr:hypothetical protein LTSEALA_3061 [Salmonella enterica subsp. enterica serovar Alachua str. R6-377]
MYLYAAKSLRYVIKHFAGNGTRLAADTTFFIMQHDVLIR